MTSEHGKLLVTAGLAGALLGQACARRQHGEVEPATGERRSSPEVAEDDRSRCAHEGRSDREVEETASARAARPNIRRVYAIVGQGEDAHRVLQCREVDQNLDGVKDVVRIYDDDGGPLRELADTDYDGQIDTWTTFSAGRVSEVKVDRNRDGRPDEKRFYVRGKKLRGELDEDFDGRTDVWEVYAEGTLQRRGVDVDRDGKVDRWDRDEIAFRAAARRERAEEEQQRNPTRGDMERGASDAGTSDASVTAPPR